MARRAATGPESGRERILDGALAVMQTLGLARTTTREIARAAGLSEAALYKHFADKEEIFIGVLKERLPPVTLLTQGAGELAGSGDVARNLHRIAAELTRFYAESIPIAMSLFSDSALLARHRESIRDKQAGPEVPAAAVAAYLRAEQALGRVGPDAPVEGTALALAGACMHAAFLARYHEADLTGRLGTVAATVECLLPALVP